MTVATVLALLVLAPAAPPEGAGQADVFKEAREFLKSKEFGRARDTLAGLLSLAEGKPEAYALLGEAWEGLEDSDVAAFCYRKALLAADAVLRKGKDRVADSLKRSLPRRLQKVDQWGAARRAAYLEALKRLQKVADKANEEKHTQYASDVNGKMIGLVEKLQGAEAVPVSSDERTLADLKKARAALDRKTKGKPGSHPGGEEEVRAARRALAETLLELIGRQVACLEKTGLFRQETLRTLDEALYHDPEVDQIPATAAKIWTAAMEVEKGVGLLITVDSIAPYGVFLNGREVGKGKPHKDGATTFEAKGLAGRNFLALQLEGGKVKRNREGAEPEEIDACIFFVNVRRTDTGVQWGSGTEWLHSKEEVPGWNVLPEPDGVWTGLLKVTIEGIGKKFQDKRITSPDGDLVGCEGQKAWVRVPLDL